MVVGVRRSSFCVGSEQIAWRLVREGRYSVDTLARGADSRGDKGKKVGCHWLGVSSEFGSWCAKVKILRCFGARQTPEVRRVGR